jgi:hypothetical protein
MISLTFGVLSRDRITRARLFTAIALEVALGSIGCTDRDFGSLLCARVHSS